MCFLRRAEDSDEMAPARDLGAGLAPEHALLQLALVAAQQPEGAALLAAQDAWGHLQARFLWSRTTRANPYSGSPHRPYT